MFTRKLIASTLFGIALSLSAGSSFAAGTSHDNHAVSELALSLNAGAKWQGDDNMHRGMATIREAISSRLDAIHGDRLPAEDYKVLAAAVIEQTEFMIENCVLEPEVDEQFHLVLGQVIEGASEMEEGSDPGAGAVMVMQALNAYGDHFEHPGWQSLD